MLDEQTRQDLLYLSQVTNQSMSELARQFIAEKAKEEKKKIAKQKPKKHPAEALLELAKRAEEIEKKYGSSGPTDVSLNIDHYLYGAPKKKLPKK